MQIQIFPQDFIDKSNKIARRNHISLGDLLEKNDQLSILLWEVLRIFETNLKFYLHSQIMNFAGDKQWWLSKKVIHGKHISRAPYEPDVYGVISLGFFLLLFSDRYHNRLWVPCLQPSFPSWTAPRRELHKTFKALVRVRNRIAHHEIIYNYPLIEIIDFAQQMLIDINPVAADEIRQRNYAKTINKIRLGSGGGI